MNESVMIEQLRFRLRFPRWMRRTYDAVRDNFVAFVIGQIVGAIEAVVVIAGFFAVMIIGGK